MPHLSALAEPLVFCVSINNWMGDWQPLLTSIIQKRRLMLFGHLIRMDESAYASRILTAVPQSDWRRPVGRLTPP